MEMEKETNAMRTEIPEIISIVGKSGSGKTTLLEKLIPELRGMGLKVGTIKHDVHGFEIDHPGKDSWRHKQAGSVITIISSPQRIGMVMDVDHDHTLDELALFFSGVDLILTEGYKQGNKPKIEIFRLEAHAEPLCLNDSNLIALMTNSDVDLGVPRFALEDIGGLAHFLTRHFRLHPP
ncbi:MAG: molybdopterin-guanine dinucleotide biosynthesis protein B [Deltaproteobacteria bacterium]|nr:MAG: molybdopterin-guanine dinucleotide biosynthesis protein B [Deltaproteobacteria bacterium]